VHKLLIMANTEPEVRGPDNGIWRRIKLAPFGVTIPEAERDKGLIPKLLEEIDGIFAWCVRGCLDWQRHGLGIVEAVEKATAQYRREQDVIGEWISERCLCVCADQAREPDGLCETCGAFIDGAPRLVTEKAPYEAMADLYEDFAVWCRSTGRERPWKRLTLRKRLLERPGLSDHRVTAARAIAGIKLRPAPVSAAWKQHQGQRDRFDE
jgi:phage/plasmid-associated DNA primase